MINSEIGPVRTGLIEHLIEKLEQGGIATGHARRFARAKEWGLSFQETYYAARSDQAMFESMEAELHELDTFFESDPYLVKHCGFPLRSNFKER